MGGVLVLLSDSAGNKVSATSSTKTCSVIACPHKPVDGVCYDGRTKWLFCAFGIKVTLVRPRGRQGLQVVTGERERH